MSWQNQGGNGSNGGGRGPWGNGPQGPRGGGSGNQPPDLEDLIRKSQDKFKNALPGGGGSPGMVIFLVLIALLGWLATGFYRVEPDEQGVVMVFGENVSTSSPGLQWNFPAPIGHVETPKVTQINRVEVGSRGAGLNSSSLMLTGDENIIDIQFVVFWQIKDARQFLFNVRNPENTVRDIAESAMREIIGRTGFELARTRGRGEIQLGVQELVQKVLDNYGAGIVITQVEMQKSDAPPSTLEAFRDVEAARADSEKAVNRAQEGANKLIERSQGQAERLEQEAKAYREERIKESEGETQRFKSVYNQYRLNPDVVGRRIYIETMEAVLGDMDKVLLDNQEGGNATVPYINMNELLQQAPQTRKGASQ